MQILTQGKKLFTCIIKTERGIVTCNKNVEKYLYNYNKDLNDFIKKKLQYMESKVIKIDAKNYKNIYVLQ